MISILMEISIKKNRAQKVLNLRSLRNRYKSIKLCLSSLSLMLHKKTKPKKRKICLKQKLAKSWHALSNPPFVFCWNNRMHVDSICFCLPAYIDCPVVPAFQFAPRGNLAELCKRIAISAGAKNALQGTYQKQGTSSRT